MQAVQTAFLRALVVVKRIRLAVTVLLSLSAVTILVLVSVAAAADLHPDGYEKNCCLCQFTKSPPLESAAPLVVPSITTVYGHVILIPTVLCQDPVLYSGSCRAPPR